MNLTSRIIAWVFRLPRAKTYDVLVERDIQVPMPDGVVLLADHYYPRGSNKLPTVLVRSPYGRGGIYGLLFARVFAERGFQALIQSCRGTFGSGGALDLFRNERADGLATIKWLKAQDWFSGAFAMVGGSYLGFVQWAVAADTGPELKAMMPQVTASDLRSSAYPGGSFWLETSLNLVYGLAHQENSPFALFLDMARSGRALRPAFKHLPLCGADEIAIGKPVPFFRDWLEHNALGDEWWEPADFSGTVSEVTAPVHLLEGWYDLFTPQTIADYERLRQAGRQPHLTIGPWAHGSLGQIQVGMRESITWLRAYLLGDRSGLRDKPVRLYVMGAEEWREYSEWPPTGYREQRWLLQSGGKLSTAMPEESEPDRYRYDPVDPTPAVGGTGLGVSGPKDNRALEARADVLCYTSEPLDHDVEVIGPVRAELYVKSSLEHTDFFARLCEVFPRGKSINVCDGLLRLHPGHPVPEADGCLKIGIDLWPTAYRFRRGHRLRLQVSSGAHPRFARNLGSGEPLATATTLIAADQTVYHDPTHSSAIILPVMA
jgi:putative CocE/NonD family hydrolase